MEKKELVNFLMRVPLFQGLEKRQLKQLATRFVNRSYTEGQPIVVQAHGGEGLFTVISGRAEARRQLPNGNTVVVSEFGPTEFFGEIALLHSGPRTASVVATEDTDCLVLTRSDFLAAMKADSDMGITISQELAKRMRQTMEALI